MPLLLMHGWPGSVFEVIDIIPRLTDPARFGGDPPDAFTVIAPSRFRLSSAPYAEEIGAKTRQSLGAQEVRGAPNSLHPWLEEIRDDHTDRPTYQWL